MRKKLILLLMVFAVSGVNYAFAHKHIFKGYVFDKVNELQLVNAFAELVGENNTAITDEQGYFELHFNDPGKYIVEISVIGYETQLISFDTNEMNNVPEKIFLSPTAAALDEIIVTGGRSPIKKKESPVVVSTINSKMFESISAVDLTQGLNFNSGLRVETGCQNCGFPQLKINGLEGSYTQMLIDGRPIMGALSGVYGLEQIPINMIDRVEIIKGGGSTLYGSNAIAGVVNIITKEAKDNFAELAANYGYSGNGGQDFLINANGGVVSKNQMHGITLFASHRERTPYDRNGDEFSEIGEINATSFGLKGYSKPTKMSKLSYEYHVVDEYRRGGSDFDLKPHESQITEQTDYTINNLNITYDIFMDYYKHKLSVYSSAQHTKRDSYYGSDKNENAYGNTKEILSLTGAQMTHNLTNLLFAPSNLIYGAEFRYTNLNDNMPGYNRNIGQTVRQWSGFVQNQWNTKKFNFLAGVRVESHNLVKNIIAAPRANILYKTNDMFNFRASYANGFKAPEAFDEDLHISLVNGEPVFIILSDNLLPERSNSYSGSADMYFGKGDVKANVIIDGFYTDLTNTFELNPIKSIDGSLIYEKTNSGGSYVTGLNFDATLFYKEMIQFKIGYTFQKSYYKDGYAWSENESIPKVYKRLRSPDHYGYFSFLINPTKALAINLNATYTGSMLVPHLAGYIEKDRLEKTESFFDLGLKVSYDIQVGKKATFQINAGVKNILNSYQSDFDKGVDRDATYVYGPTQPRTIFVGIKMSI